MTVCMMLKEAFQRFSKYPPDDAECEVVSKCVLSPDQVCMWFEHLHTISQNHKRGAGCAAATRRRKKQDEQGERVPITCGVCLGSIPRIL